MSLILRYSSASKTGRRVLEHLKLSWGEEGCDEMGWKDW